MNICLRAGLTSVQANDEGCYDAYTELDRAGLLPIRVYFTPCITDLDVPKDLGGVQGISCFRSPSLVLPTEHMTTVGSSRTASDSLPLATTAVRATSDVDDVEILYTSVSAKKPMHKGQASMLTMERVKLFADGSLGAETAALRTTFPPPSTSPSTTAAAAAAAAATADASLHGAAEQSTASITPTTTTPTPTNSADHRSIGTEPGPYTGVLTYPTTSSLLTSEPGSYTGVLTYPTTSSLITSIIHATQLGYRLEIHAIGDAAADQVLTALEAVTTQYHTHIDRPILTHCQVLGIDLIHRMQRLNVTASIQPSFVPTDMMYIQTRLVHKEQIDYAYIWYSMMYTYGIHVSGGSDAPVEDCSPFLGIHDAIYRRARLPPAATTITTTTTGASTTTGAQEGKGEVYH